MIGEKAINFIKDKQIGMTAKHMGQRFIDSMDGAFENWKPRDNFRLEEVA